MKWFCLAATVFIGSWTYADTAYETLRAFYENAKEPASLADFDYVGTKDTNQHCLIASAASVSPVPNDSFTLLKGPRPEKWGPLFPGHECVFINSIAENGCTAKFSNTTTQTDFVMSLPSAEYSDSPILINVRRAGLLLAFKYSTSIGKKGEQTRYGYCYRTVEPPVPPAN